MRLNKRSNKMMQGIVGRKLAFMSSWLLVACTCVFVLTAGATKVQGNTGPEQMELMGLDNPPAQVEAVPVPDTIIRQYADGITHNHPLTVDLLPDGSYLVARVGFKDPGIEKINAAGKVVWSFKGVQPVSAKRLPNGNTLVADSGVPGLPYYPRVLEVSPAGNVVWEHRFASLAQSPRYAEALPNGHILVTLPFMVVELDRQKQVVWSYGSSKPLVPGTAGYLEYPVMATGLANGHVLLVDRGFNGGRVLEIARNKQVVWQFGYRGAEKWGANLQVAPSGTTGTSTTGASTTGIDPKQDARFLTAPSFAYRTAHGQTMIADLGSRRLLELDQSGQILRHLDWSGAIAGYPVMNIWQALPVEDRLVLVLTLTSSHSRILELNTEN